MDANTTNNNTDTTSHSSPSSPSLLEIHTVEGVVKEWMRMCEADDENALRALQREPLMARGKGDGDGPFASNSNSKHVIVDTNTSEYDGQNLTDSQIKLVTFFVSCIMKTLANSHFTVNEILLRYAKHQGIVVSSRAQDTIHNKSNVNGISCNTMARSTLYLVNVIISFHTNVLSEIETGESWERGLPTLNTTSLGEETATVVKPRDIKYSDSATLPTRRLQQDEVTIKKHNVVPDSHSSVVKLSHEGILSSTDREDLRLALVRKRRKKFSKGNPAPPLSFMKAIIPSKAASEKRILDRAREGQSLHGLTDTSIEGRVKGTSTAVPYETVTAMGSRPPRVFGAAVMNSTEVASEQPLAIFLMHFEPVLSTIRVDTVATASSKSTPVSPESSVVTVATEAVVHLYCPMIGSLILSHRIPLTQLPSSSHTEMRRDMSVENIRELFLDGTNDFEEGGTISTPGTKGAQSHNHDGISGTRWGLIQKLNDHCRRHYGVSSGSAYNGYLTAESASEWCNLNSEGFHGSPYKMAFISLTAATPISTPSPTASSSSPRESSETARNIQNISEMKQYTLLDDQLCEVDKKKGSRGEASGSRAPENYDSSKNQLITAIKEANQRQKSNLRDIGKGTSKNILKRGIKGNDSPKGSPRGCDEEDIVCPDKPTGVTLETLITNTASGAWCKQAETTFMDLLHYGGISGITEVNIAGLVAALLRSVDMRRLTVNGDETPTATTSSNEDAASAIIENNNNPNRLENTEMAIKKEKVSEEQKKKIFISPLTMQSPRVKHCIINEAFTRFGTGAINSESKYIYTTSTKSQPNIATSSNNNNGQSLSSTPAFPSRPLLDGALLQKCLTKHPSRQSEYYTFTWQGAG